MDAFKSLKRCAVLLICKLVWGLKYFGDPSMLIPIVPSVYTQLYTVSPLYMYAHMWKLDLRKLSLFLSPWSGTHYLARLWAGLCLSLPP